MPFHRHLFQLTSGIELFYTIIIVVLCFLIYFKTKEIYSLTKYKGIQFFRNAFLFFGLAYASRLLIHFVIIGAIALRIRLFPRMILPIMPISILIMSYFSTMAILYLTYNTLWKSIKDKYFALFSNLVALGICIIAVLTNSLYFVVLLQFLLLVFAIITSIMNYKKSKKKSNMKVFYLLISLLWLINLFVLGPRRLLPFELKLLFQAISIVIFILIYNKVSKLLK